MRGHNISLKVGEWLRIQLPKETASLNSPPYAAFLKVVTIVHPKPAKTETEPARAKPEPSYAKVFLGLPEGLRVYSEQLVTGPGRRHRLSLKASDDLRFFTVGRPEERECTVVVQEVKDVLWLVVDFGKLSQIVDEKVIPYPPWRLRLLPRARDHSDAALVTT